MSSASMEQVKEELFVSLSLMRAVMRTPSEEQERGVSISELYHYASDGEVMPGIDRQIARNKKLEVLYRQFVQESALFHIPVAIVASSGEPLVERVTGDVVIRLLVSRIEPEQIYLQVEFKQGMADRESAVLNVFGKSGEQERLLLKDIVQGRCQLLIERGTPLIALLQDIGSEIFIG